MEGYSCKKTGTVESYEKLIRREVGWGHKDGQTYQHGSIPFGNTWISTYIEFPLTKPLQIFYTKLFCSPEQKYKETKGSCGHVLLYFLIKVKNRWLLGLDGGYSPSIISQLFGQLVLLSIATLQNSDTKLKLFLYWSSIISLS